MNSAEDKPSQVVLKVFFFFFFTLDFSKNLETVVVEV